MPMLETFESQLKNEYGVVKGWIAAHVYLSVGIALVVGIVIGRI